MLDTNPLGTIPLLLDGASRLTESAAICQYLAVKHSPRALNVEPDEPGFADLYAVGVSAGVDGAGRVHAEEPGTAARRETPTESELLSARAEHHHAPVTM